MLPTHAPPVSPGKMLQHFIEECEISQEQLADHFDWSLQSLTDVLNDRQPISAEIALCLSDAFGNSYEFWLGIQQDWDLWHALQNHTLCPRLDSCDQAIAAGIAKVSDIESPNAE